MTTGMTAVMSSVQVAYSQQLVSYAHSGGGGGGGGGQSTLALGK